MSKVAILLGVAAAAAALPGTAPLLEPGKGAVKTGRYIISLDKSRTPAEAQRRIKELVEQTGAQNVQAFPYIDVVAADLTAAALSKVRSHVHSTMVAYDTVRHEDAVVQENPVWGLDRIDQRATAGDKKYAPNGDGEGVEVYILDGGIQIDHPQYEGRASRLWSAFPGQDPVGTGHGTHTSGTVGSKDYGVAKKATLYAVKITDINGSGTDESILGGMNFVVEHRSRPGASKKTAVANMSVGGLRYSGTAELDAAQKIIDSGVVFVTSAGNNNWDACLNEPAAAPNALTVGATDANDTKAPFSNYGPCVDVWAPGVNIMSTYKPNGANRANVAALQGTSMASPHVAGAAAVFLSMFPDATVDEVVKVIKGTATPNAIRGLPTCPQSPNLLLYVSWTTDLCVSKDPKAMSHEACRATRCTVRESCEFRPTNSCRALPGTAATNEWCAQVQCAPEYRDFCTAN